jgi:hypothetical protein
MSAYSFHNYGCLFVKKIQNKVSACVYLTPELVQKATCNHKFFLEAGCQYTMEKIEQCGQNGKPMRLSEQFLELMIVFKEASRNLIFIFLFNKTR